jgi:hypothetical protein
MSNGNAANPYAAPAARVEDIPANAEAEAIRKAHISHEASIKAVGVLYYLGGIGVSIAAIGSLVGGRDAASVGLGVGLLLVGVGQFFAGWGVRAFRGWGRVAGCILSAIGLIGFPIGTLINGYILYLFLSKKGRMIFSPEYQDIIAATPDVKYRTSIIVWIFLALIVVLLVAAVVVPMFSGK